jgi:hypothetical protein
MGFSSILDISSFFIGMIINLIFVALMCYYFKRKYDYLEVAQNEQAKILYQLIHKPSLYQPSPSMDFSCDPLVQIKKESPVQSDGDRESDCDGDSESDSDSDEEIEVQESPTQEVEVVELSEDAEPEEKENDVKVIELESSAVDEPLEITLDEPENKYSKMSMKQLKEILSSKGIKPKTNIKKEELVELLNKELP